MNVCKMNICKTNDLDKIDLDKVDFSNPRYVKDKHFIENKTEFYIQTNKMRILKKYKKSGKTYIVLNITDEKLIEFFISVDNLVLNYLEKNFKKWFNKQMDGVSILEYFIPTINCDSDNNNNIIFEIPFNKEGNIDINIYNKNNELINIKSLNDIPYQCEAIIQLNGIYLEKSCLYCNWELVQGKFVDN